MTSELQPVRSLEDIINRVRQTLTDKGNQYGPTYRRVATMLSVQPQYSVLVRILEKCARAHNLMRQAGGLAHLQEEFIDIACYAILAAFESEPNVESKPDDAYNTVCGKCYGVYDSRKGCTCDVGTV